MPPTCCPTGSCRWSTFSCHVSRRRPPRCSSSGARRREGRGWGGWGERGNGWLAEAPLQPAVLPAFLPLWPSCPALNPSCPPPFLICRRTTEELIAQCKAMVEAEEAQAQAAQQFGEGYINESDPSGTC